MSLTVATVGWPIEAPGLISTKPLTLIHKRWVTVDHAR
jgi:hypothetical protein